MPRRLRESAATSTAVALAAGCALLLVRPALHRGPAPRFSLAVVYAVLLVAGVTLPPRIGRLLPSGSGGLALAFGGGAFVLGRAAAGGHPPAWSSDAVAFDVLAAVAEEAFFRRFAFDALLSRGAPYAVVGSAVLFAGIHVTMYGWVALPLDIAAGLVLSWQRWVSGSWGVPALTHALANVLMRL